MPRKTGYGRRRGAPRRRGGRRVGRRVYRRADGGKVSFMRNTLVPDRLIMKMSYTDNVNLSSVAPLSFAIKNFRLNSIYDPDLDLTNGHQPLGYDQWAMFYNKYRVFKAVIRATFINNQASGVQCAIVPYNSNAMPSLDDSTFEQPHVVSKTIGGSGGINRCVLTKVVDLPRIVGMSHLQYKSNEQASANYNGNPLEQVYGMIVARQVNDSAAPSVVAVVDITYYVELYDRVRQFISYPEGKDPDAEFKPGFSPSFAVDDNHIRTQHSTTQPI